MTDPNAETNPLGLFGRYLSLWVGLAIAGGVGLGAAAPGLFRALAAVQLAEVNLIVAIFIWVMIYPMMLQVEPGCLKEVGRRRGGWR
jgi:ACR3 family arsenite transporter